MFLFTSFKTDNKIQLKTQNETQNIEKIELENKINPHTNTLFELATILQIGRRRIWIKANTRYLSLKIQLTHIHRKRSTKDSTILFQGTSPRPWVSQQPHSHWYHGKTQKSI